VADDGAPARALGALCGLAIGDALGMPTQTLPRDVVRRLFGDVDRFHDGPEVNPVSRGLPAGSVTDDTDQALIVARALLAGDGHVSGEDLAGRLLAWQAAMVAKGSADLLGPSTARRSRPWAAASRSTRPAATATRTAPRCAWPPSAWPCRRSRWSGWSTAWSRSAASPTTPAPRSPGRAPSPPP
jgi:ADP-ribosylglycohydrolase